MTRSIQTIIPAIAQSEGVGATVRRSIGVHGMRKFNPFLMFDHFKSQGKGGFPEHPHLGQETITLMLQGAMAHEDFTGSKGIIREGDLQFMTAGRGVVHSEMPVPSEDGKASEGLQLWVDLPEALKETKPRYRDLRAWEVPEVTEQDGKLKVRVISGAAYGVQSNKDLAYTPVHYYHYILQPGAFFKQPTPKDFNFFLYLIKGTDLQVSDKLIKSNENVFFNRDGDEIAGENKGNEEVQFVLVGGEVLDQHVVHYGPFVATNGARIQQAFGDYQSARNGFENLKTWRTLISDGVTQSMIDNELNGSLEAREKERQAYLAKKEIKQDEL